MMDEYPGDKTNKLAEQQPNHVSDTHGHLVNTSAGTMQMNYGITDANYGFDGWGERSGSLVQLCGFWDGVCLDFYKSNILWYFHVVFAGIVHLCSYVGSRGQN